MFSLTIKRNVFFINDFLALCLKNNVQIIQQPLIETIVTFYHFVDGKLSSCVTIFDKHTLSHVHIHACIFF